MNRTQSQTTQCRHYSTFGRPTVHGTTSWTLRRSIVQRHPRPLCQIWQTSTQQTIPWLDHIPHSIQCLLSCNTVDGMDKLRSYFSWRHHFYSATQNTTYHHSLHWWCPDPWASDQVYQWWWIIQDTSRQHWYLLIYLGTFSEYESGSPKDEILWRNVFKLQSNALCFRNHGSQPPMHIWRMAFRQIVDRKGSKLGTLQECLRSSRIPGNGRRLSDVY